MHNNSTPPAKSVFLNYQRWRILKDRLGGACVVAGGFGVIVAIGLIFLYLLYVVLPLFASATMTPNVHFNLKHEGVNGKTLFLSMEEQNEMGVKLTDNGQVVFFSIQSGELINVETLPLPENVQITSFAHADPASGIVAYGLSDGRALMVKIDYEVEYTPKRRIKPMLDYPLGREPVLIDSEALPLHNIAVQAGQEKAKIIAETSDNRLIIVAFSKESSLFDENSAWQSETFNIKYPDFNIDFILLDKEQNNLFLVNHGGQLSLYQLYSQRPPVLRQHLNLVATGEQITALSFQTGDLSLLVGDKNGAISQWSIIRNKENNYLELKKIRSFQLASSPIVAIAMEQRRKGFIAIDEGGTAAIYNSTADREIIRSHATQEKPVLLAFSPRATGFLVLDTKGNAHFWQVKNVHPEVSWSSLWRKVWYESYPEPAYIWQSSAASNDFEPKFSLTPLVYGTLKAAFYAMLFAMPMAIMGAVYTAYFMSPMMRKWVKPSIEIMEALPTVILGFLAGLWLAPYVEANLAAIFVMLILLPAGVVAFAIAWHYLPQKWSKGISEGWYAAILIPVVIVTAWLAFVISEPIQQWIFDGDLRAWLDNEIGIGYDQRNALVIGLAMGFAVIPTIFSISEDAIFNVPRHLTMGSLALGATSWQTLIRLVLLTASPGIFSAVMIGFGRAVGETMIVLMATGNTPIMDISLFQGMRTLSANIAVEMPESEVDSSHYRILFLAALVLFLFTFFFNTLAEVVRQRLRSKYSSL